MSEKVSATEQLAIHGGPKAKTTPNFPMYPGGLEIGEEEKQEVLEVLERKYLFRYYGPQEYPSKVRQFEVEFSQKVGSEHALAVNSCTSALISSLIAVGVGPGCEVIVPGYTFFASAAAIVSAKAIPVVAEVDATLTLDPDDFERKITPYTKAVIPVHMRGVPCNMDRIMEIARRHDIKVVEDVAQAVGGTYHGKYLGTFGDCGAYSFQYHKIITAGEGGMVVTDDWLTYQRAMGYHDTAACWRPERFGEERFAGELFCGVNYRMSELTGAMLLAQLHGRAVERTRRNQRLILDGICDVQRHPRPRTTPTATSASASLLPGRREKCRFHRRAARRGWPPRAAASAIRPSPEHARLARLRLVGSHHQPGDSDGRWLPVQVPDLQGRCAVQVLERHVPEHARPSEPFGTLTSRRR
jgi:dTDP-4-amino-4,6-dideoxygalactose transaminase